MKLRAFCALRPKRQVAAEIASLPYDVVTTAQAKQMVEANPHSFMAIDRPEVNFPEGYDPYSAEVYAKAKELLTKLLNDGMLVREETASLYIYRLTTADNARTLTGIVACISLDDCMKGFIKKHEHTRIEKERDRIRHIEACSAQTGLVFTVHHKKPEISSLLLDLTASSEIAARFTASDGVTHTVWAVRRPPDIQALTDAYGHLQALYIADGHHRFAAAVEVNKKRKSSQSPLGDDGIMIAAFPADETLILGYHRVIRDLNNLSSEAFLDAIKASFNVIGDYTFPFIPLRKRCFGMCLGGRWYELEYSGTSDDDSRLDVTVLYDELLAPILGIGDMRTDTRIDYIGGLDAAEDLAQRINEGWAVAFTVYPVDILDMMAVANRSEVMPPKSTWFEPKLLSGLLMHEV